MAGDASTRGASRTPLSRRRFLELGAAAAAVPLAAGPLTRRAAAQAPNELAETRRTCERDQRLLKLLGLETINELTPAFCRAKAAECERQYLFELVEVLDDSNALGFGDWKADPPKPVTQQVIA